MERGWAVVTGGSGGLGREFVRQLSARGYLVLAVARGEAGLEETASSPRSRGAVVETLSADLATEGGVAATVERARALGPVELLVNNAGISTSGPFLDQAADREKQMIRVNVEALYALTRALVPDMVARGRGGVLQVASVVGLQPAPYWTTYGATKAFVLAFGEGLAEELRGTGVRVSTVCPGFMRTGLYDQSGMPGRAGRMLPVAAPEAVVRTALRAFDHRRAVRVVGGTNRILALAGAGTPRFMLRRLMGWLYVPR